MIGEELFVATEHTLIDRHHANRSVLDILQLGIPEQLGIGFFGIVQLQHMGFESPRAQLVKPARESVCIEKIAKNDNQTVTRSAMQ